jgi:hypothetical protein
LFAIDFLESANFLTSDVLSVKRQLLIIFLLSEKQIVTVCVCMLKENHERTEANDRGGENHV